MKTKFIIVLAIFNLLNINTQLGAVKAKQSRLIRSKRPKKQTKVSQYKRKRVKCEFGCPGTISKLANLAKHYARWHYPETSDRPSVVKAKKAIDRENLKRKLRKDYEAAGSGKRVQKKPFSRQKKATTSKLILIHDGAEFITNLPV